MTELEIANNLAECLMHELAALPGSKNPDPLFLLNEARKNGTGLLFFHCRMAARDLNVL
jgi:hypothetical protein